MKRVHQDGELHLQKQETRLEISRKKIDITPIEWEWKNSIELEVALMLSANPSRAFY